MAQAFSARQKFRALLNGSSAAKDQYIAGALDDVRQADTSLPPTIVTSKHQSYLDMYLDHIKILQYKQGELTNDEATKIGFPTDHAKLLDQLKMFVIQYAKNIKPRRHTDDFISPSTLKNMQGSMMFWIESIYNQRGEGVPNIFRIRNELTKTLNYAAPQLDISPNLKEKTVAGTKELRILVNEDTEHAVCIAYAECHHLSWCIASITGLRPSSMAKPEGPRALGRGLPYLTWRDIEFSRIRLDEQGHFMAKILIRNLKTNKDANTDIMGSSNNKELEFPISSPRKVENLQLSVPHRLLTMALRRKLLVGITTPEELIRGELLFIRVTEECLDQPVLLQHRSFKSHLSAPEPLRSHTLTKYIKNCAMRNGFPNDLTMYSLRRFAASEYAHKYGNDIARQILGHEPGMYTLEKHYLKFAHRVALVSTTFDEDEDDELAVLQERSNSFLMNRLTKEEMTNVRGPALEDLLSRTLQMDPVYEMLVGVSKRANYRKRLRTRLRDQAYKLCSENMRANITIEDQRQRQQAVLNQAEIFAEKLRAHVNSPEFREGVSMRIQALDDNDMVGNHDDSDEVIDLCSDSGNEDKIGEEQDETRPVQRGTYGDLAEAFMELQLKQPSRAVREAEALGAIVIDEDELFANSIVISGADDENDFSTSDYTAESDCENVDEHTTPHDVALISGCEDDSSRSNTSAAGNGTRTRHSSASNKGQSRKKRIRKKKGSTTRGKLRKGQILVICPACVDDDTVPGKMKRKLRQPANQKQHLLEYYHSKAQQFRRSVHLKIHPDGRFRCPMCEEVRSSLGIPLAGEDEEIFVAYERLVKHIKASDNDGIAGPGSWKADSSCVKLHQVFKWEEGFYDEDFEGDPVHKAWKRRDDVCRLARKMGFVYDRSKQPLAKAIDVPMWPDLIAGGPRRKRDHPRDEQYTSQELGFSLLEASMDELSTMRPKERHRISDSLFFTTKRPDS
ncbi:hypothetical protein H2198_008635 [Neophaeococcomyces mojaviensis]|uniref:Uncharacterized protein n=1 Tax=Neophaeococcomyces mojaviensis TaxID=3383035 RepID=A0ACC2ZWN9_9EURO|nr:hypothetical protein H2198_008635 [Knufia sp. JES_112]